jgi:dCMP deaminase
MSNWNERWMQMANLVASWSEDKSTKVGSVIVDDRNNLISIGWNGFPRKVRNLEERNERPIKYHFYEHSERNAIFNVAAKGDKTLGCTLYSTLFPCCDCCRAIIQSGISKLVTIKPDFELEKWGEQFKLSLTMLLEAGVNVEHYEAD